MSNTFTMPLGPVHVALEEPVYFHLTVEGETVRHVELTSGHVHRGMEAMATQRNLVKNVTLTERVCSLCSNSHSFTYSMVVENVLGITIPERACYLRVVAEEIKRLVTEKNLSPGDRLPRESELQVRFGVSKCETERLTLTLR